MEQSVPKRRHIKFRRLGITQKKAYDNLQVFNEKEDMYLISYGEEVRCFSNQCTLERKFHIFL